MTRSIFTLGVVAAGLSLATAAHAAPSVEVRDAVARVVVTPEARQDIRVDILTTNPSLPLTIRTEGDLIIIDGDLDRSIRSCRARGERSSVTVSGVGEVAYADMPQVVIRTPMAVGLKVGGAVFGVVGRSQSLTIANAGCGEWTLANISGKLDATLAGPGDLRAGAASAADLRLAGSGDMAVRQVSGPLAVDLAGSGDVKVATLTGSSLKVNLAGSGDVEVAAGKVDAMSASVTGSGDVRFDGEARSLQAAIVGSGDIRVREVTGAVNRSVIGSGDIRVGESS